MNKYLVKIGDKDVEYYIRSAVSFEAAVMAYKKIIDAAFQAVESGDGEFSINYAPFMVDLARSYALITLFTDIDLSDAGNETVWKLSLSDVTDNILADEYRSRVARMVCGWADAFIDDYKTRILTNKKRDDLFEALKETTSPDVDMGAMQNISHKLDKMSDADILDALIRASKN